MNVERAYGVCLQSYFGGRAEARIRKWEVPVCPVDFMSQYPTVNELLGNWDVLTAKRVTFPDATKEVRKLLSTISLERCFDRKLWPRFKFFGLVYPNNEISPVRTVYNGTTQNIGINYFTSKEPFWFAGPDIVASILLTGKVPRIRKAIAVVPHGTQEGLRSVSLRGMVEIDANKHSFFKHVIEQRAAHESDLALHYWLKILANSGSYGLFVELNPNEADNAPLNVFSGEESFETTSDVVEELGDWFAPHIASLITAGGRLLLAMLEKCIADMGGAYLFCDTDGAALGAAPSPPPMRAPRRENLCPECGKKIRPESTKCASCVVDDSTKKMLEAARIGRQTANGPEAQKKRAVKARANALAQHSWKESDQPAWLTAELFTKKIQPLLANVPISAIRSSIGVSKWYASKIRQGYRPHPRNWLLLAKLVGIRD